MSPSLHRYVRRWWGGGRGAAGSALMVLAAPLEWGYARAVARRNRRWDRSSPAGVPGLSVVCVGNLTVGGTGKTPMAAWAARVLADAGAGVALLSRGYARDELLLHHRWNPDVPVLADPDRVRAARMARAQGAKVVVLDDGFQHRNLARDLDVVLLAAEDPFPGRLLPRGPYREPDAALGRAHAVVVTRRTSSRHEAEALFARVAHRFPHLTLGQAALVPGGWQDLAGNPAPPPEGPVLAVAAVARPEAFEVHVESETGQEAELMAFPDHHDFRPEDVRAMRARAGQRTVVVTEKDAVKLLLHPTTLGPVRVLVQTLRWESGEEAVTQLVTDVTQ